MRDATSIEELESAEIAIAQVLSAGRADDPDYVREVEGRLLDGIDQRRRFEEWRFGTRLVLRFRGFERREQAIKTASGTEETVPVLEIRAKVRAEKPNDGGRFPRPTGGFHHWPGPAHPRPAEGVQRIEDLPKRGEYGEPKGDTEAA